MFDPLCFEFQPSIANATNIDTLLVATESDNKIVEPPEAMQDKVGFIFNNLSQLNLSTKVNSSSIQIPYRVDSWSKRMLWLSVRVHEGWVEDSNHRA